MEDSCPEESPGPTADFARVRKKLLCEATKHLVWLVTIDNLVCLDGYNTVSALCSPQNQHT